MIISESPTVLVLNSRDTTLLAWCVAGSVAAHVLMLMVLPGWHATKEMPPVPLTVELREPPPAEIVPPKPLLVEPRPVANARVKPAKVAPREERPIESVRAPILTASPDVAVTTAAPVVPEQKSVPVPEPPRPQPAPVAAPAAVTLPRFEAAYLRNPAPNYPLAAKRRGESGTVLLRVLVTPDGNPASVTVFKTSGSLSLDDAAASAVRGWKFVPGREGDKAVQAEVHVPIVFNIKNE